MSVPLMDWSGIRYFKVSEFDSPDVQGSGINMSITFVAKLDQLRGALGFPLKVHSGYRTKVHNATVGGVDSSAHETGVAADLEALNSTTRFKLIAAAIALGFRRIGIGATFIHLDDDNSKPQEVVWLYPSAAARRQNRS